MLIIKQANCECQTIEKNAYYSFNVSYVKAGEEYRGALSEIGSNFLIAYEELLTCTCE